MRSIKSQTATLEARIEAAELLTTRPAINEDALQSCSHAARVLGCMVHGSPEARWGRLLVAGLDEDEALRYSRMTFCQARDEVMNFDL